MFRHLFGEYNKHLRPEFFPTWLCYISVRMYAFFKRITGSNILRFTRTNPGFPLGGLYPSGKWEILEQLPSKVVPTTVYIDQQEFTKHDITHKIATSSLEFPIIVKPDNGLRGLGIQIFHTKEVFDAEIQSYIETNGRRGAWLFQEFVEYPLELGVFYIRKPSESQGRITGIVEKEFLFVEGNGILTVEALVHLHPRAKFHFSLLAKQFEDVWNSVLKEGERLDIVEIGTHSRGSTFLDRSTYIREDLTKLIDSLSQEITGFYYGRFDIRAESLESLVAGKFKVMEINPTYGEPTWMYDPSYSFWKQQSILLQHRSMMYEVAKENKELGVQAATVQERKQAKELFTSLV